jgi:CelD/BcsL family acetyltransferase involved in cellulose biosynthesis
VKRLGPVSFNRYSLLGEEEAYGEYAPLVEAGSIQEVVPLAVSLFARDLQSGGLDAIDFHGFSPDLEFMTAFAGSLGARVHVRHVRQNQPHMVVEGAASGEMYLKMMSNRRRHTLRRQERSLSEAGAEIEVVNGWDGGKPFEDLVRLHTARWARDGQPGRFGSQRFAQFLRDVTEVLMPLGQARIYFTRFGTERISGLLVFDVQRQNYQYLVGRDPMHKLMRYSVGEVLAMRATMDAFDEGSIVCDMMGGDYHHKHYTGMTKRWYSRLTAVAPGWKGAKGHLYCGALATRDKVGCMSQVLNHARSDTTRESKAA